MYNKIKKARAAILVYLTHGVALPLLKKWRRPEIFPFEKYELSCFPEGSLGKDLDKFLSSRNLPLLTHYARHDIKHIVLGYDTTEDGEVCLQCFMLGNGHVSFPVIATFLYGFITMPEFWALFTAAFRRGRNTQPISWWPWFGLLPHSTTQLQSLISNK